MALLAVDEAMSRVLADAPVMEPELVPLAQARGRVLAHDTAALLTQPPFNASAMDGYAVRGEDVAQIPVTLSVIGEAAAGHGFAGSVGARQAVRIFTGAPLPEGADAIVIQENVETCGDSISVRDGRPDAEHVRPRGGDFREGLVLLNGGTRLNARAIILAAAMGHGALNVRRKPRVAIIATGDELVAPGTLPGPDQIISSNPHGLAAMLEEAGAEPHLLGIARDTHDSLAEAIARAADAEILLTIGGASVGKHDLVGPALESAGMTLGFWKIAMRPGKPLIFGKRGSQRVIGLPGNPVSAMICTRVFVVPLVRRMLALDGAERESRSTAVLAAPLSANGPRTHYMRARYQTHEGQRVVRALPNQDSSLLTPLAQADCLIVREAGAPAAAQGTSVSVLDLDF